MIKQFLNQNETRSAISSLPAHKAGGVETFVSSIGVENKELKSLLHD